MNGDKDNHEDSDQKNHLHGFDQDAETMIKKVKQALANGEGCRVYGVLDVQRVAGNFHFSEPLAVAMVKLADTGCGGGIPEGFSVWIFEGPIHVNVSHIIHDLSFGPKYPGIHNPLDETSRILRGSSGTFKYYIKSSDYPDLTQSLLILIDADSVTSSTLPSSSTVQRRLRTLPFQRDVRVGLLSTAQLSVGPGCMCLTLVVLPLLPVAVRLALFLGFFFVIAALNLWPYDTDSGHEALISPSSVLRFRIERGDFPYCYPQFKAFSNPPFGWQEWVDDVLSDKSFCQRLQEARLLIPVKISRSLSIRRNNASLEAMALRWSTETHTFILGQHEMGPTLEDVFMLLRLEVTGPDAFDPEQTPPEDDSLIQSLKLNLQTCGRWSSVFDGSARRTSRVRTDRASYTAWIRHFFKDLQPLARDADPNSREYEVGPMYDSRLYFLGFLR
ncbi:unnamed protein product [Camellia sinensis]